MLAPPWVYRKTLIFPFFSLYFSLVARCSPVGRNQTTHFLRPHPPPVLLYAAFDANTSAYTLLLSLSLPSTLSHSLTHSLWRPLCDAIAAHILYNIISRRVYSFGVGGWGGFSVAGDRFFSARALIVGGKKRCSGVVVWWFTGGGVAEDYIGV